MAWISINFESKALGMPVMTNVLMPQGRGGYKTLYLLHGAGGDYASWLLKSRVADYAEGKNIAVVMPSGNNKCYVNNRYGKDYCTRIAVRESILNEFVVQDLRKILQEKIDKEKLINSIDKTKINNDKKMLQKKIANNNRRIEEITKIIKTAYEDRVNGLLDTQEFVSFTESYKKEKQELIEKTEKLNIKLSDFENNKENELMKYIKEIVSFKEINRNIILNLIDSIEIINKENIKINYKFTV